METCISCKFIHNIHHGRDGKAPVYICRRYPPPAQFMELKSSYDYIMVNSGRFQTQSPSIAEDWWCGEYQQKVTPA
jgi:hypothetical protein